MKKQIGMGALVKPSGGYTEMRGVVTKLEHFVNTNGGLCWMFQVLWFNPRHGDPRFGYAERVGLEVV